MKQLSPAGLQHWIADQKSFQLIDVREAWEHEAYNIGGREFPFGSILEFRNELRRDIPVVLYCEKGIRSSIAIQRLEAMGFDNLYNLSGGMTAWRKQQAGSHENK